MKPRLKRLRDQVIVITGASSGIGLVTARMAAKRGARVVITSRNAEAIRDLAQEIQGNERTGGVASFIAADVADEAALGRVADLAIRRFGRIDTWVNGAGVSIYGRLTDVSLADQRRLFETNFWGVVHGSRISVEHLRTYGGALINIGSTLSDRAIPLQGIYSASKHAVKAYTDSLRMELEHDRLPISVTLVKPGAIDTPYAKHAKNYMAREPKNPPPLYSPEVVAETILYCAEHPVRDVFAGGGGKMLSAIGQWAPRLTDKVMETLLFNIQQSRRSKESRQSSLHRLSNGLQERSGHAWYVARSSLYTRASLHPVMAGAVVAAAGLTLASLFRPQPNDRRHSLANQPEPRMREDGSQV